MMSESNRGPMPLADALIAWSNPELVDEVRRVETLIPASTIRQLKRWTLDDLRALRRTPCRYRTPAFGVANLAVLDAAWDRLCGAFRSRVERGEITLDGVPTITIGPVSPMRLPRDQAAAFEFDPAAGAVFVGITTYVGVTANLPVRCDKKPPNGVLESGQDSVLALPLPAAIVAWGEPNLVRLLTHPTVASRAPRGPSRHPPAALVPTSHSADEPAVRAMREHFLLHYAAKGLVEALERDLRRRLEYGELVLHAVQTWPARKTERESVPGLWASDFWFDLKANQVGILQFGHATHRYAAALITRAAQASAHKPSPSAVPVSAGGAPGAAREKTVASPGGRRSAAPSIEAALRQHWDAVFPNGPPLQPPVWTELAAKLLRRVRTHAGGQTGIKFPAKDTLRKHLPKIYMRILTETSRDSESAQ
jgi:hypothetical protein